jgi:hypothetical protein
MAALGQSLKRLRMPGSFGTITEEDLYGDDT